MRRSLLPSIVTPTAPLEQGKVRCINCRRTVDTVRSERGSIVKGLDFRGFFITWKGPLCPACQSLYKVCTDLHGDSRPMVVLDKQPSILRVPLVETIVSESEPGTRVFDPSYLRGGHKQVVSEFDEPVQEAITGRSLEAVIAADRQKRR